MPRRHRHAPLRALLNNRLVGHLSKALSGAISFQYDPDWLEWDHALPVSLSLPLREDAYRGEPVVAVFDNLLPDSEALRRRVAEKVGAAGVDAYSLLTAIGHDCVGALQFAVGDEPIEETARSPGKRSMKPRSNACSPDWRRRRWAWKGRVPGFTDLCHGARRGHVPGTRHGEHRHGEYCQMA